MIFKKSTRIWLLLFAASAVTTTVWGAVRGKLGCFGVLTCTLAFVSGMALLVIGIVAAFRAIVRRLTLRLAFSYFLIGIVPIPLLAMLLFSAAYLLAHQFVATRMRREVTAVAREMASREKLPALRLSGETVESSEVPWLKPGEKVTRADAAEEVRPVLAGQRQIWIAVRRSPDDPADLVLIPASGSPEFLQRLADRTGYAVWIEAGRERRSRSGLRVETRPPEGAGKSGLESEAIRPRGSRPPARGILDREWVGAVYVERVAFPPAPGGNEADVVAYLAKTSPRVLAAQLFAQGIPSLARIFRGILVGLSLVLLLVYLVALAIAFTLVGSIARNVNRLTRASEAIARGDLSVRVQSRSRDQIGDLARSFDGMAASIERLLKETAEKERLDGEIAVARTIQQKLMPAPEASLPGLSVLARFQPVAAIGGDYYDYLRMPDGRSAVAVGDVSGHGLPTGLLVAMAKAGLSTLIESGLTGRSLFARLNDLMHRSTDSRNYMTLALLAYDASSRRGELTNAGQLAPYRLSAPTVRALALPSFPLGLSERLDFAVETFQFAAGDRLVFVTDGFIEASDEGGEPFGFERLEAVLCAEASSDAARLRDAIAAAVEAYTGDRPQEDDRTIVVLTVE
jgi:serine phosphatase RsbU (regulator of sigma subunit)